MKRIFELAKTRELILSDVDISLKKESLDKINDYIKAISRLYSNKVSSYALYKAEALERISTPEARMEMTMDALVDEYNEKTKLEDLSEEERSAIEITSISEYDKYINEFGEEFTFAIHYSAEGELNAYLEPNEKQMIMMAMISTLLACEEGNLDFFNIKLPSSQYPENKISFSIKRESESVLGALVRMYPLRETFGLFEEVHTRDITLLIAEHFKKWYALRCAREESFYKQDFTLDEIKYNMTIAHKDKSSIASMLSCKLTAQDIENIGEAIVRCITCVECVSFDTETGFVFEINSEPF